MVTVWRGGTTGTRSFFMTQLLIRGILGAITICSIHNAQAAMHNMPPENKPSHAQISMINNKINLIEKVDATTNTEPMLYITVNTSKEGATIFIDNETIAQLLSQQSQTALIKTNPSQQLAAALAPIIASKQSSFHNAQIKISSAGITISDWDIVSTLKFLGSLSYATAYYAVYVTYVVGDTTCNITCNYVYPSIKVALPYISSSFRYLFSGLFSGLGYTAQAICNGFFTSLGKTDSQLLLDNEEYNIEGDLPAAPSSK